jgi:hypothetical protein
MKLYTFHEERHKGIRKTIVIVSVVAAIVISLHAIGSTISLPHHAFAYDSNSIKMTEQRSFFDSTGNLNVVGVVNNVGRVPISVTVGLNTSTAAFDSSKAATTYFNKEPIYGRIIYPLTGAPFKFVLNPQQIVASKAFVVNVNQISVPNWNVLALDYSNMPFGKDAALIGTARNIGTFDLHNVSVYASVHSRNGTQIDSVKSNVIPVIKPGQQISFIAKPDPAVKSGVFYYSCAGFDLDAPITTLNIGNGQFIPYDLRALARVSDFKYDHATDSIIFGVKYYSTIGGPLTLKIPQVSETQSVHVMMDGKLYNKASVKMNGKTVSIDFFVPPEDHNIQIKGVRGTEALNTT